jgi:uncharacterized protein
VGRSEGVHDHGLGEQDDVRAALGEMERRFPGLPIVLGGFSFGSVMALRVGGADPRVRALFALGFPLLTIEDLSFLQDCRKPRLFVQGSDDQLGPGPRLVDLVAGLPEPRSAVVIPASDHFFTGQLDKLQEVLDSWLATSPWAAA